ncbi:MAG: methyltransferase domain-containing protein [Marinobacter sp.]|nr:methyltransferase domain-containing protein [Marinobacter sp.]
MGPNHKDVREYYDKVYYKELISPHGRPSRHLQGLVEKLALKKSDRILDVACGSGEWLRVAQESVSEVAGIDISEKAIEACRKVMPDGRFSTGPAEELPYADNEFDVVTCLGSLEHFLDQQGALEEILRVAKQDARILILVPNSGFLTYRLGLYRGTNQQNIRETIRSLDEWAKLFERAGLEVNGRWKDLHVLSRRWIFRTPFYLVPLRMLQAAMLVIWPLNWQYQVYFECRPISSFSIRR